VDVSQKRNRLESPDLITGHQQLPPFQLPPSCTIRAILAFVGKDVGWVFGHSQKKVNTDVFSQYATVKGTFGQASN
jgi:hypothetical protein